ncbi:MAG TPA: hypothetical protein VEB63_01955 [Chitinophagaceae bacterium]|nr:hypothetical protein [Chitinophagaceae bacterium]
MFRVAFLLCTTFLASSCFAQDEQDTLLKRCPIFITDTVSSNNFFIEALPATVKVDRIKGDLTVVVQQRDQFFTIFFGEKKLRSGKYSIKPNAKNKHEAIAKYSFKSGDQVSYINVANGTIEASFDEATELWRLLISGTIANVVERNVSYYRVRGELFLKD